MDSYYRTLILCSSIKEAEKFTRYVTSKKYPMMQFVYPPNLSHDIMSPDVLLKDCRELCRDEEIEAVIVLQPKDVVILAALANEFPGLKGPTMESAFLCVNRYYCKQHISYGFTTMYALLDLEHYDAKLSLPEISNILDELGPAMAKPTYFTSFQNPSIITSVKQFNREADELIKHINCVNNSLENILKANVSHSKYDGMLDLTCVIEETVPQSATVHLVEGCIVDEEYMPFFISDLVYWPEKVYCVQSLNVPTKLEDSAQFNIWATMREVANRLIQRGFNNSYLQAKVLLSEDGNVKVLDINSCIEPGNIDLYNHVYTNGNILAASVEASLGRMPCRPKLLPHRHALRLYLTAFSKDKDCTAGDVLNYKQARLEKNVYLEDEKTVLSVNEHYGHVVATVTMCERSYPQCIKKGTALAKSLLHEASNSPWLDEDFSDLDSFVSESAVSTPRLESRQFSELSFTLPSKENSRDASPDDIPGLLVNDSKPASPEIPKRGRSLSLVPIPTSRLGLSSISTRRWSPNSQYTPRQDVSPRRLSPILSARLNGHLLPNPYDEGPKHKPTPNKLSPLAPNVTSQFSNVTSLLSFTPSQSSITSHSSDGLLNRSSKTILSPVETPRRMSIDEDVSFAKMDAHHNRRRSIDVNMTSLERARHMRRLSDAAFSTIKLPSLENDYSKK